MASRHDTSTFESISLSPSLSSSSRQPRPPQSRANSGRSILRSAEEQLRHIREGDTSWQCQQAASSDEFSVSRPTSSSSTIVTLNGEDPARTERTVRVYLHHVRKTDTIPLILLAYEISAAVLKKANRLWATDSIQSRDKLYIPVDECGVEPQPCPAPQNSNDYSTKNGQVGIDEPVNGHGENGGWPPRLPDQGFPQDEDAGDKISEEWVMIPGIGPIQIISLPIHKLSYFPVQHRGTMERSTSLPTLDSLVAQDKAVRDSMDSAVSRSSSIGSFVEDGVGKIVRFWHDNQGKKKWAKIGKDLIEL